MTIASAVKRLPPEYLSYLGVPLGLAAAGGATSAAYSKPGRKLESVVDDASMLGFGSILGGGLGGIAGDVAEHLVRNTPRKPLQPNYGRALGFGLGALGAGLFGLQTIKQKGKNQLSLENQELWDQRKKELWDQKIKELGLRTLNEIYHAEDFQEFDEVHQKLKDYRDELNKTASDLPQKTVKELLPLLFIPAVGAATSALASNKPNWYDYAAGAWDTSDAVLTDSGLYGGVGAVLGALAGAAINKKLTGNSLPGATQGMIPGLAAGGLLGSLKGFTRGVQNARDNARNRSLDDQEMPDLVEAYFKKQSNMRESLSILAPASAYKAVGASAALGALASATRSEKETRSDAALDGAIEGMKGFTSGAIAGGSAGLGASALESYLKTKKMTPKDTKAILDTIRNSSKRVKQLGRAGVVLGTGYGLYRAANKKSE